MNLLDKLEAKLGRFAIRHLMAYVAAGQAMFWMWSIVKPEAVSLITFSPGLIGQGQAWRVLSWVFLPPEGGPIWAFFGIYMNWWMGGALEQAWGEFRFNLFYLCGIALNIALGFSLPWAPITPYYLNLSLFFAFATLFPNLELLLFFILPVKVKWLAFIAAGFLVWGLVGAPIDAAMPLFVALANYLLFFAPMGWRALRAGRQAAEGRAILQHAEEEVRKAPEKRCHVCGAGTDKADIRLCLCPECGPDGRFHCTEHLADHLKPKA